MQTLRLGIASVRRHSALYAGSFVALTLGIALIAGVALLSTSVDAAGAALPAGDEARQALDDALTLLGVMAGFAGFMTVFVVSSTFSFTVTARRRELGLLRLVGALPRQVRRQVRAEALVVAVLAAAAGAVLGLLVASALAALLTAKGTLPDGLAVHWSWAPVWIAAGVGIGVALLGAWTASRRAARVPPSQALREAADGGRRIGVVRGVVGTLCLAGAGTMLVAIRAGDPLLALMMAIFVPELVVVGLVCWGPVLLPPLVRVLTWPLRGHPAIGLARENVAAQARRTTSMAAPVLAISAIAGSLILTLGFAVDWDTGIARQQLRAPLVVTTDDPSSMAALARDPRIGVLDGRQVVAMGVGEEAVTDARAEGVDPAVVTETRGTRAFRGDLSALTGRTMAISRSAAFDLGFGLGSRVPVRFTDGTRMRLRIVAITEDAATLQEDVLVPLRLARAHGAEPAGTWFVRPAAGVDPDALRRDLPGDALTAAAWIDRNDAAQRRDNQIGLIAILGPTGLYAGLAIANTLLMGSLQRRREFAVTRLIGATAAQVRRMVLAESAMVATAALLLGSVVTVAVAVLLRTPMTAGLEDAPLTVPWASLLAIAAACLVTSTGAAVLPVSLLRGHPSAAPGDHQ